MSSEGSETISSGSRIRQFGLYRTIDARTEEFLRLSRKRQIKQGCACAAVSTAITVTVVVVILLIYEYAIAVEWSLVQNNRNDNRTYYDTSKDSPFADRLDRSYFGFDQDYYERMPLLVNALQETNYNDPILEMTRPIGKRKYRVNYTTTLKPVSYTSVRRTSPRPFIFEYRSPTPLPFSKTYGSKSWVENYRNAQRLQNIQKIVKYLETTINAKVGDMHMKPADAHIAFTGVYIEPIDKSQELGTTPAMDSLPESSNKFEKEVASNHKSDPLFNYKPVSPGEVNLLADAFLRFSPIPTPSTYEKASTNIPLFKPIPRHKINSSCLGIKCKENLHKQLVNLVQSSSEIRNTALAPAGTKNTKSFSVMLNLFPLKPTSTLSDESKRNDVKITQASSDSIYITTSRPIIQFRRKSTIPLRQTIYRYKRPRILNENKTFKDTLEKDTPKKSEDSLTAATKMVLHFNVFSPESKTEATAKVDTVTEILQTTTKFSIPLTSIAPIELSTSEIEDFHVGSSGIIPINTTPMLPMVTTATPFFDTDTYTSHSDVNTWSTNPPDILKFSADDAKIPDRYKNIRKHEELQDSTRMNRRISDDNLEDEKDELSTLVVKLKKIEKSSVTQIVETVSEDIEETTSMKILPQTNGHYRNLNQSTRPINNWPNSETKRKRRLEMSVGGYRKHSSIPTYVEIRRNNSKSADDDD